MSEQSSTRSLSLGVNQDQSRLEIEKQEKFPSKGVVKESHCETLSV